jgi:hypothetical protein
MRRLLVVLLALGFAGVAMAANIGTTPDLSMKGLPGDGAMDGREGGETVADALPIPSLPYTDTGATCDNINDYDEICPYSGSTSPDVVYVYTPAADETVDVDLCYSGYDTKVYVYENAVGNLVGCNDDFYFGAPCYVYSSKIEGLNIFAGNDYFIVVDGYGGSCGTYQLDVTGFEPCVVECPDGALIEGEPPCVDGYYDLYNGGCNSTGWTLIEAQDAGCATMCGVSCTYNYQGLSYRDTDWFTLNGLGGLVTAEVVAEFPVQFIFIYGTDCNNLVYDLATAGPCQPVQLSRNVAEGVEFWLWVGPQVFSGLPESDYVLDVCGIQGEPTPTVETTWGSIKTRF